MAIYSFLKSSLSVPIYAGWRCSKCNEVNLSKGELGWSQSGMASGSKSYRENALELNSIDLQREWPERTLAVMSDPKGLAKILRRALLMDSVTCSNCNTIPEWAQTKSLKYTSIISAVPEIYMPIVGTLNREFIEYADKRGILVPTPDEAVKIADRFLPEAVERITKRSTAAVPKTNNTRHTPPKLKKIFCRKCGKELLLDSQFCNYCGTKVEYVQTEIPKSKAQQTSINDYKTATVSLSWVVQTSLKAMRKDRSINEVYGWTDAPKSIHEMIIYVYKFKGTEEELKNYLNNAVAAQVLSSDYAVVFLEEWKRAKQESRSVDSDNIKKYKNASEYWLAHGLCPKCGGKLKKSLVFPTTCLSCDYTQ